MEQNYVIKITGTGTKDEIIASLTSILSSMTDLQERAEWEDETLFTVIATEKEGIEESYGGWSTEDVQTKFEEMRDDYEEFPSDLEITKEQKEAVIEWVMKYGDASEGISWKTIETGVDEVMIDYKQG